MATYTQLEIPGLEAGRLPVASPVWLEPVGHLEKDAMLAARYFLIRLKDAKQTPRVPRVVRAEAKMILARYPSYEDLQHMRWAPEQKQ